MLKNQSETFMVNFESDKVLSFENSNEQGTSYRADITTKMSNKSLSQTNKNSNWFKPYPGDKSGSDLDSDSDGGSVKSRKSKKKGKGNKNISYQPSKDRQNVAFYKTSVAKEPQTYTKNSTTPPKLAAAAAMAVTETATATATASAGLVTVPNPKPKLTLIQPVVSAVNNKKKRAKKRKATMPIGGADHKKVIESASPSENDEDMKEAASGTEDKNPNEEWESELMLKDKKWSVSKGIKNNSSLNELYNTPIIIKHNVAPKLRPSIPQPGFNILLGDSEDDSEDDQLTQSDLIENGEGDVHMQDQNDGVNAIEPVHNNGNFKSYIAVECLKMNECRFHGVINYTEAREKIFINALNLSPNLLGSVRMTYHKCPTIHFKFKKDIDVSNLPNQGFYIERKYHSGGMQMSDRIQCRIVGLPKPKPKPGSEINTGVSNIHARNDQNERREDKTFRRNQSHTTDEIQTVRINGITSTSDIAKVRKWLVMYGELMSEITEDNYYEPDPDADKVGNGVFSVQMKIKKQIPNFLPALGLKIRIHYKDCILLCPNCYRVHPRRKCLNAKLTWIGYVNRFIQNNPALESQAYGRWWQIVLNEYQNPFLSGNKTIPENHTDENISRAKNNGAKSSNHTENNKDHITNKLREIRNKTKTIQSDTNLRDSFEKSIEKLVSQGLSNTEAVEYENNQSRNKQLQEKMSTQARTNQYSAKKTQSHA